MVDFSTQGSHELTGEETAKERFPVIAKFQECIHTLQATHDP